MTKERVTVDFDEQSYYLDGEYWESWDNYGEEMADAINKLLNDLAEENIKLHIQNDFLKDENHHMRDLVNENRQLKEENKELKQELLEIIDASSDNRPNKKGFAGTGRFA